MAERGDNGRNSRFEAFRRRFAVGRIRTNGSFVAISYPVRGLDTFSTPGSELCSFSEQMDTSTLTGKMISTVLGAAAEIERSLIAERVRAGIPAPHSRAG
jgi:hypothetical protein